MIQFLLITFLGLEQQTKKNYEPHHIEPPCTCYVILALLKTYPIIQPNTTKTKYKDCRLNADGSEKFPLFKISCSRPLRRTGLSDKSVGTKTE